MKAFLMGKHLADVTLAVMLAILTVEMLMVH